MLKSLLYIAMAALLVLNGMVYSLIQGSYELNKATIIENFCINKTKPELKCDGKCYLAQQLKAEREKQEQNSQHSFSLDFGQFIAFQADWELSGPMAAFDITFSEQFSEPVCSNFISSIDIPPQM
ncbi:hypothetical protein [Arthrospiribacter ruber]|uniref:Uncharacterized protein n=1 Tax=Arthrospiribacter ruber TaxID=2487934 RepID=A0A951IWB1_9BACT|nr:hypothetical protein [Arthrospiribacter ruber]MBW3466833.1 hypothetical protein [Arthrospiribacter ruber]